MKKQISAIITAMLILGSLTACSDKSNAPGNGEPDPVTQSSTESLTNDSSPDTSFLGNTGSKSEPDNSFEDINPYERKYPFIDKRGVYGETEIPDFHIDKSTSEGCEQLGVYWVPMGLESMEFESLTYGGYTIKLVGKNVRTDEENFPGKIFMGSCFVEIEKDGGELFITGVPDDVTGYAGAQYQPGCLLYADKIGSYLDIHDMELPVLAMRYYFGDSPERLVHKAVDFAFLKDGEWHNGFTGKFEPGCGVYWDWKQFDKEIIGEKINVPNEHFTVCVAALFEADKFKLVDKNTLLDEEAGITYTFDFELKTRVDRLGYCLYTAEKNVGSVAAASEEDWVKGPFS